MRSTPFAPDAPIPCGLHESWGHPASISKMLTFLEKRGYISAMLVSIGKAAEELGVTVETLRRWEAAGKIEVERTPGGHRRYDLAKLRTLCPRRTLRDGERCTLAYARVARRAGKNAMARQVALLESYCAANGWDVELIQDFGS
ncbi:MAG: MerR family DNA-binding transcriptional regulator, partial [Deltaproteobacteria bacterium]